MNVEVLTIEMEPIIIVISLLFEEEKRVSLQTFLDFVALLGFILEDGFMKVEVEKGNIQRWKESDEKRATVDLGQWKKKLFIGSCLVFF